MEQDETDSFAAIKKPEGERKRQTVYMGEKKVTSSHIKARKSVAADLKGKHCLR